MAPERNAFHIRLFDVLHLDTFENLGIDLQVAVDVVGSNRPAVLCTEEKKKYDKLELPSTVHLKRLFIRNPERGRVQLEYSQ